MVDYDSNGDIIEIDENIEKSRQAAFEQISKHAILVDLKIRQFSNMPFDADVTDTVATAINANAEQLQVRKFLIKPEYLSKIRQIINDACLLVVNHTRPWENVGPRVLPMEFYDDFTEAFGQCVDEFEAELHNLENNWDTYVQEAKKNLGPEAFCKKDYPAKDQLKDIFHLSIETSEFPDINDIRLGLGGKELMTMKEDVEEQFTDALHEAFDKCLEGMKSTRSNNDLTMFFNIANILNVSNNPELEVKLAEMQAEYGDRIVDDDEESMMVMDDIDMAGYEDDEGETVAEVPVKSADEALADIANNDDEDAEDAEEIDWDNVI